ncbi:acyltransferase [Haloimpatiens sp. FM7315]|uniref:acyltransferase n=1 Tax=Haloimpatiens sp. FM7315 TaxID=3298609 RepID=UPI00370AF6C7
MHKNKSLKELNILRAIAFILVVEQHTMGGFYRTKNITNLNYGIFSLLYVMAKPAVSIFVCISGIVLFYNYSEKFNVAKYYKKRISSIIIPYITWSLIYLFLSGDMSHIIMILLSGGARFHLWYMGMIIRLLIYFPIILYLSKKVYKSNTFVKIAIFILLVISYYYLNKYQNEICHYIINLIYSNPTKYEKKFINISPLFWYLYFIIGIYISFSYDKFKKIILKYKALIFIGYIFLLSYSYLNQVKVIKFNRCLYLAYCVFSFLALYIVSVKFTNKTGTCNFFNFISRYSFSSYLAHIWVLGKLMKIMQWSHENILLYGLTLWLGTSIAAPFLMKLITYIPFTKVITGKPSSNALLLKITGKTGFGQSV